MEPETNRTTNQKQRKMRWRDIGYAAGPALFYTAFTNVLYSLLQPLAVLWNLSGLTLQAVTSAICLAVFGWWMIRREQIVLRGSRKTVYRFPASFCYVSAVVMWGIACNQMIYLSGLRTASEGYRHVTQVFYGNGLLLEVVTLCVLGPLLEELVYRGLVYQRVCEKGTRTAAVVLSAAIFGLMHFNIVQCIYAGTAGLLLAYIVAKTGSLVTAAAAHGVMNLVSVLWTETDWLDFLNQSGRQLYLLIGVCLLLTFFFLSNADHLMKKMEADKIR